MCETPKSPPGDYNDVAGETVGINAAQEGMCETPKSPPGDYNRSCEPSARYQAFRIGVKHLNPRQGITTRHTRLPDDPL